MRQIRSCLRATLLGVLAAGATPQAGVSQTYPTRPVQLVNTAAEGGAGDFVARLLAEKLARPLGQPVAFENRPGASGITATQGVVRAAPDGYTLLIGHTAELAIHQHLVKDLGYSPERDLQPISLVAVFPLALVVRSTVAQPTLSEFLASSRASSRGLLFASSGTGTPGHLASELLRLRTGARLTHVPYDGGGPALQDLLQGRVDFYFSSLAAAMPHLSAGQLKALALSTARRSPALPNVPTVAETGIRDFNIALWIGVFAPRGTPRDVVARLNREVNQVLAQPDVRERIEREGGEIVPMSIDQFTAFVRSEAGKFGDLIREEFCSRMLYGGCLGFGTLAD